MKNILIIFTLIFTLTSFAQRNERVKALKIAFITERLELNSSEAQKFWPVYNAIETKKEALRKQGRQMRKGLSFESLDDSGAKVLLQKMLALEDKKNQLQIEQVNSLLEVIPAKKVLLLKVVEDQFNKRMMEEIKKRREKFRGNRP
jgi:hypothetical protein